MSNKVKYEVRKNKNGKQYGVKIDLKTNKAKIVKLAYAKRRISDNKYQRKKTIRVNKEKDDLVFYEVKATHEQYKEAQKTVEAEYRADPDKAKWTEGQIKSRSKINAMRYRTGYAMRVKLVWRWWAGIKIKTEDGILYKKDDTPKFTHWTHYENLTNDHIDDPEKYKDWNMMKKETDIIYDDIMNDVYIDKNGVPAMEGGACLVFYNKLNKKVLHVREWKPDGCDARVTMNKV